jgi:drug/metabolite transporter (DMT)-like permease
VAPRLGPRVWLALATIYVVWGSTFMAVTIAVRDLPPLLSMGLRHVAAGTILLAWGASSRRPAERPGRVAADRGRVRLRRSALPRRPRRPWLGAADRAFGRRSLLIGSIPLWMALLDRVVFGKRLHPLANVGLVGGFVGLAFLLDPFGESSVDRAGAVVALLAAFAWAAGTLYARGAALPKAPLVSAGLGALCGGVLLAVSSALAGELDDVRFTADALGAVAYLVVVGTLIGFTLYVWLLRVAPTSLVSTYAYVNPIVAVFLGLALLGEDVTLQMLVAGAAIVLSVALILRTSGAALDPGRGLLRRRRPRRGEVGSARPESVG